MKLRITAMIVAALSFSVSASAQNDTAIATERAISFADNLIKAFRYNDWDKYLSLSYPGVVKYYGGKNSFISHVQTARALYGDSLQEDPEKLKLLQIANDYDEWQCVIEKTREAFVNGRKGKVVSYIVGQSKDEGRNWKFFDVAHNSVENVIYIMPDIFSTLAIPDRKVVFDSEESKNTNVTRTGNSKKASRPRK